LAKNPDERPGWEAVKAHSFFEEVDWNKILSKDYETPNTDFCEEVEFF